MRTRGFLVGGTAGRTTLSGEGLQHQDGHSHLLAYSNPRVLAYDPAYAYEIAVLVEEGIRRMYGEHEPILYYLTVGNEPYAMPPMPEGAREGILRGLYRLRAAPERLDRHVRILGSGALLNHAVSALEILGRFGVSADVWSVTSYQILHREAIDAERWNRLHPEAEARVPYVAACLDGDPTPVVAVSDYVQALPHSIAHWIRAPFVALGTDGFGRSDGREALREFFEVNARHVAVAALTALFQAGCVGREEVARAIRELGIDPEKPNPLTA
jgi:pyruvate dehydrogenase E1 component